MMKTVFPRRLYQKKKKKKKMFHEIRLANSNKILNYSVTDIANKSKESAIFNGCTENASL